jgi:hypothetical protein
MAVSGVMRRRLLTISAIRLGEIPTAFARLVLRQTILGQEFFLQHFAGGDRCKFVLHHAASLQWLSMIRTPQGSPSIHLNWHFRVDRWPPLMELPCTHGAAVLFMLAPVPLILACYFFVRLLSND